MVRNSSLSGFPEFLPQERIVELHILDIVRQQFELHGFSSLETRSVESLQDLSGKGETDKEIYLLQRLQNETTEKNLLNNQIGLHFDLTLPLARYVTENFGHLNFPFRRYQIQKVWRGERPQDGRAREFTQADIDIVGEENLSLKYDIELALVIIKTLQTLPIPPITLRINNRKLIEGFYRAIGIENILEVLQIVDKMEKIGSQKVFKLLQEKTNISAKQANFVLQLATIKSAGTEFVEQIEALQISHELIEEGLYELETFVKTTKEAANTKNKTLIVDLSIARGLDYYTGTVYETTMLGHENLGSICSGGRYANLAKTAKKTYPGVGMSIGITRLVSRILNTNLLTATRTVPTVVYIALYEDKQWVTAQKVANFLRNKNISVEVAVKAEKLGKQIRYADKRKIPFVWFINLDGTHEIKDIRTGKQQNVKIETWTPNEEDLKPQILATQQI